MTIIADDDMVKDIDAHEFTGPGQPFGQINVVLRRLGVAGRVIVREDDGGGTGRYRLLEDLPWVDDTAVQTADGDL